MCIGLSQATCSEKFLLIFLKGNNEHDENLSHVNLGRKA